ncbi:MAG: hypothetical protein WC795_03330 [Candidatus Paceibacterota bacterium]|jgi:hypothetical protein
METLTNFLAEYKTITLIFHGIGVAVGIGAATVTDILFFKFLKDKKISHKESETINALSPIIWVALVVIIFSGLALYLPGMEYFNESSKFLLKMVIVGVIVCNGAFLNFFISPKLGHISFGDWHKHKEGEMHTVRKVSFALGGISIISWYSAFILGSLRSIPFSFSDGILFYILVLAIGIIGSQFFEYYIRHKA